MFCLCLCSLSWFLAYLFIFFCCFLLFVWISASTWVTTFSFSFWSYVICSFLNCIVFGEDDPEIEFSCSSYCWSWLTGKCLERLFFVDTESSKPKCLWYFGVGGVTLVFKQKHIKTSTSKKLKPWQMLELATVPQPLFIGTLINNVFCGNC